MSEEYVSRSRLWELFTPLSKDKNCPIHIATEIDQIVETAEAENVRPVQHGHWYFTEYEYFSCSACGESYYNGCDSSKEARWRLENGEGYSFCPLCGAIMDEEA